MHIDITLALLREGMGDPLEEIIHRFHALDFQAEFSKYLGLQRCTEVSNRKASLISEFHPKSLRTRHFSLIVSSRLKVQRCLEFRRWL